jgi:hypothetical protein
VQQAPLAHLRINLPVKVKEKWQQLCDEKNISQQRAAEALVMWFISQDDVAQSMLLGQLKESPDLIELMTKRKRRKRYGGA